MLEDEVKDEATYHKLIKYAILFMCVGARVNAGEFSVVPAHAHNNANTHIHICTQNTQLYIKMES